MAGHKKILLPHPIIRPGGIDYSKDCHFDLEIREAARMQNETIKMELFCNLTSDTVNELVKNDKARFCVVLKCTRTNKRSICESDTNRMEISIPLSDCVEKISLTPYVATTGRIRLRPSNEHDAEFQMMAPDGVMLPVGAILAVGGTHEVMVDSIERIQAAIKISIDAIEEGAYSINTDGDYIDIKMHGNTHRSIEQMRNKSVDLLYPSIYLAAIEYAIRKLEESSERRWARALKKTLKERGIEIDHERLREESYKIAQEILEKPLVRIIRWNDRRDEDD